MPSRPNGQLRKLDFEVENGVIRILIAGECKQGHGIETMPIDFEIEIDESGLIRTIYRLHIEKQGNPQLGISYLLLSAVEKLA